MKNLLLFLLLFTIGSVPLQATLTAKKHSFRTLPPPKQQQLNPNLLPLSMSYDILALPKIEGQLVANPVELSTVVTSVTDGLQGKPYNYPNPFRLKEGTDIVFYMDIPKTIMLYIYNSRGHRVAQQETSASLLLQGNPKKIHIDRSTFGWDMSAGIYYYIMLHEGKVIGKGKMAIIP